MISHKCTRFEKINATVLHIEGSVLVKAFPNRLNYERSSTITRTQLREILVSPTSNVPPPISIQMSDFGWLSYPFAIQEVYYDLRGLSGEPGQSGASAMTAKLLSSLSTATDGFGVGTQITEKIEQCLLSRPPVQRLEHFLKVPLLMDGSFVTWNTPPEENSVEYSQLKKKVNTYLEDIIDASNLRKVITAFQVGKLAKNIKAYFFYNNVHVHLRLIYDAVAVGQQLSLSGTITNLVDEAKKWLEDEYSSAMQNLPKSGIHLGERDDSHLTEINEPIVCGYIYHRPDESMKGPGNLLTTGEPEPPLVVLFPTAAVKRQSATTVPISASTAAPDVIGSSVTSTKPAVVGEQLPENSNNDDSPNESVISTTVVPEKSRTDSASQSGVVALQNQSPGDGAGDSLAAKIPAPLDSVTQSTSARTKSPQPERNERMLNKVPEEDASKLRPNPSDRLTSADKQTGLSPDDKTFKTSESDPSLSENVGSSIKAEASSPTTVPKSLDDDSQSQSSRSYTTKTPVVESPIVSSSVAADAGVIKTANRTQPSAPDNFAASQKLSVNPLQELSLALKLNSTDNSNTADSIQAGPSPVVVILRPTGSAHTHTNLNKMAMIMAAFISIHALHWV